MPRGHRIPRTTEEKELRDNWKKRERITVTCAQLPCDGAEEVWVPHQRWPTYLRGLVVGAFVRELPPHLHARISRASNKDPDLNAKRAKDSGTNAKNKGTDKLHQGYVEAQRVCYCHLDGPQVARMQPVCSHAAWPAFDSQVHDELAAAQPQVPPYSFDEARQLMLSHHAQRTLRALAALPAEET